MVRVIGVRMCLLSRVLRGWALGMAWDGIDWSSFDG
jgi:hypothetical protein